MTGVVHLCMFTMLCNFINTFLRIMCGHYYFVLSVAAILVVLLMDCVAPGMIVILLVLPILLVLFLPEVVYPLSQGSVLGRKLS